MSKALIPIIIATIAGLSTVIGSLIIFIKLKPENTNKFIVFCLALSISIMVGISITDLIPESSYVIIVKYGLLFGIIINILIFIAGSLIINILNKKINTEKSNSNLYKIGILSMITLMTHNFPDGCVQYVTQIKILDI